MADLGVYKGRDDGFEIFLKDNSGVPIDITGYTFYMMVKENISDADADAKITKTVTTHINDALGHTRISIDASDTSSLDVSAPTQDYVYDISYKDDSGDTRQMLQGVFKILKPVKDTIA